MGAPIALSSAKAAERYLGQSTVAGLPDPTTVAAGGYYEMTDAGTAYGIPVVAGNRLISNGTVWAKKVVGVLPKAEGGTGGSDEDTAAASLDYWRKADVVDMVAARLPGQFTLVRGSGEYGTINDSTLLEFGDATADKPFAVYVEVAFIALGSTEPIILKSTNSNPVNEWGLIKTSANKIQFSLYDENLADYLRVEVDAAVLPSIFYRILVVYDGSGTAAGLKIYVNGILVPQTTSSGGTYVAMHGTSADVTIGKTGSTYAVIAIAEWAIYDLELTAADAAKIGAHGGVAPENQWSDDAELVTNGGFENWTGSVPDNWTVGSSITVSEETVDVYAGASAVDLTCAGASTASTNNHLRTTASVVSLSKTQHFVAIVKNKSAGTLELSTGYYSVAEFDGTTLTPTPTEFDNVYTRSEVVGTRLTDLGGGWFKLEVWYRANRNGSAWLTFAGTGQWLIDSVSLKNRGARLHCAAFNTVGSRCIDASSNKLDTTLTGTVPNRLPAGRSIHSPSDLSTDVVEQITSGITKKVIHRLKATGLKQGVIARQASAGYGYEQIVSKLLGVDAEVVVGDLFLGLDRGFLEVVQSNGSGTGWAKITIEGPIADPTIELDRHGLWSTTKGISGKICIYRDGAASNVLTIQNKTIQALTLTLRLFGNYLA